MTVRNQHPEYKEMHDKWVRAQAVCGGQDAIYAGDKTYLPALTDQTETEYLNYKKRTPFYNASWRTVVGLQGMLFRKPPTVKSPDALTPMLENITLTGTPLHILALEVSEECLKTGRVGLFCDFPQVSETATFADAIAGNFQPSLNMYTALDIINWKTKTIKNKTILSMVVLQECKNIPIDEFTDQEQLQYRVLDLVPIIDSKGNSIEAYRVRVFKVSDEKANQPQDILLEGPFFPRINGEFLQEIPFQFIGVDDVNWKVDEPPLIDLFDMNLSHYRTSADYEHGCHFTGLPTPVISGYTPDSAVNQKFYIGSMTAWVFPNAQAKATYLEFTGQGLSSLLENLVRKEGYMAILGARMLEVQVRGVESANTAAIHRGGEQSMLSSVAQAISIGFTKALKMYTRFAGLDDNDVDFQLNRDFFPVPMDALTITAIIAGWQNSAYSYDTMFGKLQQGEIIPLENKVTEELQAIAKNPPPALSAPTTPGNVHPSAPKTDVTPATPAPTITQLQNK